MEYYECKLIDVKDNGVLTVAPLHPIRNKLIQKEVRTVELRFDDGRTISNEQRAKIYAIIYEIAVYSGHDPQYLKDLLKWRFCMQDGRELFSLSDCDMTTAWLFIDYLIDFCFAWEVPTKDTLLNQCDDISRYLYLCLMHRRCAICNKPAEVHHVDRVGIGRNREEIVHIGMKAIALCHKHHMLAHDGEQELFKKYHIYGIALDRFLCERLKLNTKDRKENKQ